MNVEPRSDAVTCGGWETHVTEWGAATAPAVVLWHGLARTGRDFDELAKVLARTHRVICPDTIGRGLSQWSTAPDRDYCFDVYAVHALELADALGLQRFAWVGTSMGAALGLRAAATTLAGRLTHLVLNDMGPTFPAAPFERIKAYVGKPPEFATVAELEAYFRQIYAPFGWQSDAEWRRMTETSLRRLPTGRLTTHYDPAIVRQFFVHPRDFEQWDLYDRLTVPTLVLRGAMSDLLLPDVAQAMTRRGPRAQLLEVTGCGHAPILNADAQIMPILGFLEGSVRG